MDNQETQIQPNNQENLVVPVPPNVQVQYQSTPKKYFWLWLILFLVLLVTVGVVGYFYLKNSKSNIQSSKNQLLILPEDFPKDYIPVKYVALDGIYNYPPKDNKPFALGLVAPQNLNDSYESSKKYYEDRGWAVAEEKDVETKNLNYIFTANSKNLSAYLKFSIIGSSTTTTSTLITLTIIPTKK